MANSGDVRQAIAATNQSFMATFKSGDAAGLAALYTENGQLLPPQSDIVTGRSAIQAFWQGAIDMGIKEAQLETVELEDHGDSAVEIGKATLLVEGGQVADVAKYVVLWKNDGGNWKLHRDIWNTSLPAAG